MKKTFDKILSNIACAYIVLCIDISFGNINILPNWWAYYVIFDTLPYIAEKQRSAALLKNFIVFLGIFSALEWVLKIFGITFNSYFIGIFITVIHCYTHFQLLTNLADIAAEEGRVYSKALTRGRNVAVVAYTATVIINRFVPLSFVVYTAAAINILAQLYLAYQLFLFSAELADEESCTVIENMEV